MSRHTTDAGITPRERAQRYLRDRPDLIVHAIVLLIVLGTPVAMALLSRLTCLLTGEMC